MDTKSKMFSSAPVTYGLEPNSMVELHDFGFPGALPTINKQAVVNAIRVANALNMEIDDTLLFERKNYFYSDLPKGYQLTQQFRPIGKNGYLDINTSKGNIRIGIERAHIEEDTCKQVHINNSTLLDYNRAGIPLIEIVTKPEIKSGEEAQLFVDKIRSVVSFLGVSSGKMETGAIRCDVNVSLKPKSSNSFGTKVEIKNLNSLSNIKKAIDFEIDRQNSLLKEGKPINQETRRFDEHSKNTVLMRVKTDEVDYKLFTDPNLPPVKLSKAFIKDAISSSPELAESKHARYIKLGLSKYDADLLISDISICNYFDELISFGVNAKLAANWINGEIRHLTKQRKVDINELGIEPQTLAELILLIQDKRISSNQGKELFNKIYSGHTNLNDFDANDSFDTNTLRDIVLEVISSNKQSVLDYNNGKDKALGHIVGQVMKVTNGQADAQLVSELVKQEIKRSK